MSCNLNTSSEAYADFITRYYTSPEEFLQTSKISCADFIDDQFAVVYLPLSSAEELFDSTYAYTAIPKLYSLLDFTSMDASGILQTAETPTLSNNGRGVLIGFVDTGIDYQNPLFQNPDGSSRILGIWDQTIESFSGSDSSPHEASAPFNQASFRPTYGTQYTKSQIDQALRSDIPNSIVPSVDEHGHGTALASIAAGGLDEAAGFIGAAPQSAIGVVKLKPAKQYLRDFFLIQENADAYQENDIMMGISYLFSLAREFRMPLVICIGLGTNSGSHTGTSTLSTWLNSLSGYNGTAFVVAAGNETGFGHHFRDTIAPNHTTVHAELNVGEETRGFSMEFWAEEVGVYSIGFISPSGQIIPGITVRAAQSETIRFLLENTEITIYSRITTTASASQLIFLRWERPQTGLWTITITNLIDIPGTFHIWLPCRGFISDSIRFLRSDPDTLITGPGNAQDLITVAAYDHMTNGIDIHSSRGYSRNGLRKPNFAAPGVSILSASLRPGFYTRITGTSAAAAHVTGAAAILLSWGIIEQNDPYMNSATIKTYLIRGANRNPSLSYPNREFGYGTLNLYQTFLRLRI